MKKPKPKRKPLARVKKDSYGVYNVFVGPFCIGGCLVKGIAYAEAKDINAAAEAWAGKGKK